MDLARAPRRTARKKGSGYENGFGLDNFGSDRILNISQLSDYKRPIRSDAHLLPLVSMISSTYSVQQRGGGWVNLFHPIS